MATGMMGMSPADFWEMTLHDFFVKLHYWNAREEQGWRSRAELARLQTLTLVNIQLARKDKIRDPRRLWTFPWEREEGPEETPGARKPDRAGLAKMARLI